MTIDRANWHSGGDYPQDLPPENAGTHIGMYLAWAILHGLESELHQEESAEDLARVRARLMTGRDFLFKNCDGKFTDEDLSEEGNAFTATYYLDGAGQPGPFLTDYEAALAENLPSLYHVEDTWQNYDRFDPYASAAYNGWKAKPPRRRGRWC